MAKVVWSFNTTVRNPERMEHMLRVLSELEGKKFDAQGQEAFFGLQIKKRLYKPEKRTLEEADLIAAVHDKTSSDDIEDSIVERILLKWRGKKVDGAGRGRMAAGILNRFGLCVALESRDAVIITPLAKKWLAHEIDDEELFTKFFLKWQYANEIEEGYEDFDIKPFIGTLLFISGVNQKWSSLGNKAVGLSKFEYSLFVPALIRASQIEEYIERVIAFRIEKESKRGLNRTNFMREFEHSRALEIFGPKKNVIKALGDLRDYMDSSIRYFRVSGLLTLRGEDTHVDIARDKTVEVKKLLESISASSRKFTSYDEYFTYLGDINALALPWQDEKTLEEITKQLINVLKAEATESDITTFLLKIELLSAHEKVKRLEALLYDVRLQKLKNLRNNIGTLDDCIHKLTTITRKGYETLTVRPSLDLEWYISRSLMVLNDAILIRPSFNIGDDGIPTGFRSNVSDIECMYKTFGMTVEVTLLVGRDQSYAEGQPVKRHFRDFEDQNKLDAMFCIFVAPHIHRDTLNTFWENYEGRKQEIIPLTIEQFIGVLKKARTMIGANTLSHLRLYELLNSFVSTKIGIDDPRVWISKFETIISSWK